MRSPLSRPGSPPVPRAAVFVLVFGLMFVFGQRVLFDAPSASGATQGQGVEAPSVRSAAEGPSAASALRAAAVAVPPLPVVGAQVTITRVLDCRCFLCVAPGECGSQPQGFPFV